MRASAKEETSYKDGEVMCQVTFMNAFMQQIPDFDWGFLGEASKIYAADLRQEIDEKSAQAAQRVAEERGP